MLLVVDGLLIRQTREALGMTRKRLSEEAGVSVATLKKVEAGCAARPKTVYCIASALGVDPRSLASPKRKLSAVTGALGIAV